MKDLLSLFLVFFKIGLFSFGGGYAMLTLIEAEVVDKHKWITKSELGDIFAIAESTPGPIAVNTATFIGTKKFGVFGGIFATLGVVLPSFIIISVLSVILGFVKDNKWVNFLFRGIRVGVLVLIAKAVISFFKDMRKTLFSFAIMTISFVTVFFFKADVIYVILCTIGVCSVFVAVTAYINNLRFHTIGTPEYYNERIGKPVEKDEYIGKKAEELHIVKYMPQTERSPMPLPAGNAAKAGKRRKLRFKGGVQSEAEECAFENPEDALVGHEGKEEDKA